MRNLCLLFLLSLIIWSCTNDAYETGDSKYSYLRTDFVEVTTNNQGYISSAITDNDVLLSFSSHVSVSWAEKIDSTYRGLLYYNIGEVSSTGNQMTVKPLSLGRVYVLNARPYSDTINVSTDPVHFQSAWKSKNGSYANLSLALMTGLADSVDTRQSIGLVCDTIVANPKGNHTYYYRLTHSQGGVPEYYKSTIYVSIPTKKMTTGDIVRLSLNTYNGIITKDFLIK